MPDLVSTRNRASWCVLYGGVVGSRCRALLLITVLKYFSRL